MTPKKILVIGSGARENAICRALSSGDEAISLYAAPGNPGTARFAKNVQVSPREADTLVRFVKDEKMGLVICGPEQPLVDGLVDKLRAHGIACVGPSRAAAQLEGSKTFSRELAGALHVPSPQFCIIRAAHEIAAGVRSFATPPVVKADGLASGKGVFLPDSHEKCIQVAQQLLDGSLGISTSSVVLEERLTGVEASLFYACHNNIAVLLPHAQDHKRLLDEDRGPNTGGMGAISPNPAMTHDVERYVYKNIVLPVLTELTKRGTPFDGILFVGVMLTAHGPKLLEFNVRLGDPEAEVILPRLAPGAFLRLCTDIAAGTLSPEAPTHDPRASCAVVLADPGYPDNVRGGLPLEISDAVETSNRWVEHAGTTLHNNHLVSSGGRVLVVVSRAERANTARQLTYDGVAYFKSSGLIFRKDIGGGDL